MKQLKCIAAAALTLVLHGCASMSKNECLNADWYALGYQSGVQGQRETQFSEYRKVCAGYRVTPDIARYFEGRDAGLQIFCEPANGYQLGRAGTAYPGVCPQRFEGGFRRAYGAGREIFDTQQDGNRPARRTDTK